MTVSIKSLLHPAATAETLCLPDNATLGRWVSRHFGGSWQLRPAAA
jgi:hypothetical protein